MDPHTPIQAIRSTLHSPPVVSLEAQYLAGENVQLQAQVIERFPQYLAQLDYGERDMLMLYYYMESSYAEIAATLQTSVSTVRRRMARATEATFAFLATLRPYLAPESRTAQWETTNEALAQQTVYLAQNWAFGSRYLQQTSSTMAIRSYSGWRGPAGQIHVIGGDFVEIPIGSPHREHALALLRHMQSREVQEIRVRRLGWPSVRTDVDVPTDAGLPPHEASVQEALRLGIFRKHLRLWTVYEGIVSQAVTRILWHHEAPKEVLSSLSDELAALRGQAG